MRTSAGWLALLVSPTRGWMSRPSVISRAHLVRYSWARWMGLRVWKAATVCQPLAAKASRVLAGGRRYSANSGSWLGVTTSIGPARQTFPWARTIFPPGWGGSLVVWTLGF